MLVPAGAGYRPGDMPCRLAPLNAMTRMTTAVGLPAQSGPRCRPSIKVKRGNPTQDGGYVVTVSGVGKRFHPGDISPIRPIQPDRHGRAQVC